ncbi:polysaccharide biosynthesis protein [Bacillus sp. H-16]|uniref:putative polysaccharide biosynthesis protein n=1 Tax=Alteribacter salitolerans TaxID=2912333 RepID=UPI001964FF1E|nr:polysaccharide biosynthesis protein [Alteribacter salitolerans]MBM7097943.1 polysaccharide biosynthesis protein [Alteribacter salitolerans]
MDQTADRKQKENAGKQNRQSFLKGALYLSLAAVIVKILSAVYKVPYQNITGDVGFYVYQQVYPFYGIALVLATYGFPVIISKLVADEWEKRGAEGVKGLLIVSLTVVACINLVLGLLLYSSAPALAGWIGDDQLAWPLRAMAAPFLIMPFVSVLRGYYQGMQWMTPSAVSQVVEQSVRVAAILLLSTWAMQHYGPYEAGVAAALGSFFGAVAALFVLTAMSEKRGLSNKRAVVQWRKHTKAIAAGGFFVCISAMSLVLMQLIDALTMVRLLGHGGIDGEMIPVLKGIYDRGWPMVQMGTVITTSFSLSLVPLVAKAAYYNDEMKMRLYAVRSLKIGTIFGGASAAGLAVIMPSLNPMLFTDREGELALQILSMTVFPASVFLTAAAVLHGVGKGRILLIAVFTGMIVKGVLNVILVPFLDITGAAAAALISYLAVAIIVLVYLTKAGLLRIEKKTVTKGWVLAAALLITTAAAWQFVWLEGVDTRTGFAFTALSSSVIGGTAFLIAAVKLNLFRNEEWKDIPKLSSIISKLERKKGAD